MVKIKPKNIGLLIVLAFLLIIPFKVNADEITDKFDTLFVNNEFVVYTDQQFDPSYDISGKLYSVLGHYSYSSNGSSYYLNVDGATCNNENTCNFKLLSYGTTIKTYENIKIVVNTDISSEYDGVLTNNKLKINYSEDMLPTENDKFDCINNYLNKLSISTIDSSTRYSYNSYNKQLTKILTNKGFVTKVVIKQTDGVEFDFQETEFSDDFKKLTTDGVINIKTDFISKDLVSMFINNNITLGDSKFYELDGNIVNNKVYVSIVKHTSGGRVELEKHLITINQNAIDSSVFARINAQNDNYDLKMDEPDDYGIFNYKFSDMMNFNFSDNEGNDGINIQVTYDYNSDIFYVKYVKNDYENSNNNDIQFHKINLNFTGYSNIYSENFDNLRDTIKVRADELNDYTINEYIRQKFSYDYYVLNCNDDATICDIAYKNPNDYTIEIHKVNFELDNTITDEFKNAFKLNANNELDIITDVNSIDNINYCFNSSNYLIYYDYSCYGSTCNLDMRNYKTGEYESHRVNINFIDGERSTYYKNNVNETINVYPGENNYPYSNSWTYDIIKNEYITIGTNYSNSDKVLVAIMNENGILEVHETKIILKDGMSDNFKKLVNNDNSVEFNAIYRDNESYLQNVSLANMLIKTKKYGYINNYSNGKAQLFLDCYESHTVDVKFKETNSEHKKIVDEYIKKIDDANINIMLNDLEIVNYIYYNSDNDNFASPNFNSIKLLNKFKSIVDDKHITYFYVPEGGAGGAFFDANSGKLLLYYDGIAYGLTDYIETGRQYILYVPSDTAQTKEAYIKAAQKRIDDYLGKNSGVVVSYNRELEEDVDYFPGTEIDSSVHDGNVYNLTYKGFNYEILISRDSSKMQDANFAAIDVINNVTVSSTNVNYPSNTIVSSEYLNETDYSDQLKKLGIKNADIIDINLYSSTIGDIKKFNNTEFNVSVPISEDIDSTKDVYAYYITDDGEVEKHLVKIEDGIAYFSTGHFSTYIIANELDQKTINNLPSIVDNPKTGDNFYKYVGIAIISILVIAGLFIAKKKLN